MNALGRGKMAPMVIKYCTRRWGKIVKIPKIAYSEFPVSDALKAIFALNAMHFFLAT